MPPNNGQYRGSYPWCQPLVRVFSRLPLIHHPFRVADHWRWVPPPYLCICKKARPSGSFYIPWKWRHCAGVSWRGFPRSPPPRPPCGRFPPSPHRPPPASGSSWFFPVPICPPFGPEHWCRRLELRWGGMALWGTQHKSPPGGLKLRQDYT